MLTYMLIYECRKGKAKEMKKFEIGKKYSMTSPCDHNCVWVFKVTGRTEKTITVINEWGDTQNLRVNKKASEWNNAETVYPLGKYSMCPALEA